MPARGATYDRPDNEFVPTPPAPIHALLDVVSFSGVVCDPCCGDGAIMRVLRERGYQAFGYDIRPQSCADSVELDFLRNRWPTDWPCDFLTNPPFGVQGRLAELFIGKCLEITRPYRGKFAMLLASDFDSAGGRTVIFRDHKAFAGRVVLLERIVWYDQDVNCPNCAGTGRASGGGPCGPCKGKGARKVSPAQSHVWLIWDWKHEGPPWIKYQR